MAVKVSRIQRRVFEIGLVGRIAHNLARYMAGDVEGYFAEQFLLDVQSFMVERRVPKGEIGRLLRQASRQAKAEVDFFHKYKSFTDSSGGTSITIEVLIGTILDDLGYTE